MIIFKEKEIEFEDRNQLLGDEGGHEGEQQLRKSTQPIWYELVSKHQFAHPIYVSSKNIHVTLTVDHALSHRSVMAILFSLSIFFVFSVHPIG